MDYQSEKINRKHENDQTMPNKLHKEVAGWLNGAEKVAIVRSVGYK